MVDKSRARLRPRSRDILAQASQVAADDVTEEPTAGAETPAEAEPETPPAEEGTETTTDDEGTEEPEAGSEEPETPEESSEAGDESWIDELTPFEPPADPSSDLSDDKQAAPAPHAAEPEQTAEPETKLTAEQQLAEIRRKERLSSLSTVDADVANELYENLLKPEIDGLQQASAEELSELRKALEASRKENERITQEAQARARANTNEKILKVYPRAAEVLQSKEFKAFLNTNQDAYVSVDYHAAVVEAYRKGDSDYVISKLNAFKESLKKPTPAMSVDQNSGGNSGAEPAKTPKETISEKEFRRRRAYIIANYKGPEQGRKLTALANKYSNQGK